MSNVTTSEIGTVDTLPPWLVVFSVSPCHVECIVGGYMVFSLRRSVRNVGLVVVKAMFQFLRDFVLEDLGDSHVWV